MKNINFKALYKQLSAMPLHMASANTITEARAEEIAKLFGDSIMFTQGDFEQANRYGQTIRTTADLRGQGKGMYSNAEALYFGYLYDMHREAQIDSEGSRRRD